MTTETPDPTPRPPASTRGRIKDVLLDASKLHLAAIVLLFATTLGFAGWRWISMSRLEDENAAALVRARAAMVEQTGELLRLTASPLAWAMRAELLANDPGDIDAYMEKLVQEKYVKRIVLVDREGNITASTNTKLKGQPAAAALVGVELTSTSPRVDATGTELRMVVPVMGFDRQIATLVLDYAAQSIDAKLPR